MAAVLAMRSRKRACPRPKVRKVMSPKPSDNHSDSDSGSMYAAMNQAVFAVNLNNVMNNAC